MYYVYMLRCKDNSLYTGWTTDIKRRLEEHNEGIGGKYTRARLPVRLVHQETLPTKQEAMKREYAIKQLKKYIKEKLILDKAIFEK
ncbi:GIY-YIG nuclease family protein [Alkalibaculum sp. M08DMB]|uniref:GIY-YIG nuclease family protein n=1 Tax=Alkalibaculum sporogenes TaxID=2655001 RepID=A0A6A7KBC2_9FIRM|nr:GIY-YIG nuclease family protein [Alkalibaculum sporogenes]MPW26704.1 GIY-YIG nuclease family protein [Alkalibaculum sporogenes]